MELNIYYTKESWTSESPDETLEGEIKLFKDNVFIETYSEGKTFKQLLSPRKIFAITHKLPYDSAFIDKELNLYFHAESWSKSSPEESMKGCAVEGDTTSNYIAFIAEGYKQFISLQKIFAFTFEI